MNDQPAVDPAVYGLTARQAFLALHHHGFGLHPQQISTAVHSSTDSIVRYLTATGMLHPAAPRRPRPRVRTSRTGRGIAWTRQAMLEVLREAIDVNGGTAPTSSDWERSGQRPCLKTFLREFPTWSHAVAAAGSPDPGHPDLPVALPSALARLESSDRDWLLRYATLTPAPWTVSTYRYFRLTHPAAPPLYRLYRQSTWSALVAELAERFDDAAQAG